MTGSTPSTIKLHKKSRQLEVVYADGTYLLSAEYLRVSSPSAEVKGHGPGQEQLQSGKLHVGIDRIEAVGNYAIKIVFNDGHDSGIFSWDYLHELGTQFDQNWKAYLHRLDAAGLSRDPNTSVVKLMDPVNFQSP